MLTLGPWAFAIQRPARFWIRSRVSLSLVRRGSHIELAYSNPDRTNAM